MGERGRLVNRGSENLHSGAYFRNFNPRGARNKTYIFSNGNTYVSYRTRDVFRSCKIWFFFEKFKIWLLFFEKKTIINKGDRCDLRTRKLQRKLEMTIFEIKKRYSSRKKILKNLHFFLSWDWDMDLSMPNNIMFVFEKFKIWLLFFEKKKKL